MKVEPSEPDAKPKDAAPEARSHEITMFRSRLWLPEEEGCNSVVVIMQMIKRRTMVIILVIIVTKQDVLLVMFLCIDWYVGSTGSSSAR